MRSCITSAASVQLYDVKEIILEQKKLSMAYDHHKINNNNSNF